MSDIKAESKNDNSIEDVPKVRDRKYMKDLRQVEFSCQGGVRFPEIQYDAVSLENSKRVLCYAWGTLFVMRFSGIRKNIHSWNVTFVAYGYTFSDFSKLRRLSFIGKDGGCFLFVILVTRRVAARMPASQREKGGKWSNRRMITLATRFWTLWNSILFDTAWMKSWYWKSVKWWMYAKMAGNSNKTLQIPGSSTVLDNLITRVIIVIL